MITASSDARCKYEATPPKLQEVIHARCAQPASDVLGAQEEELQLKRKMQEEAAAAAAAAAAAEEERKAEEERVRPFVKSCVDCQCLCTSPA